MMTLLHNCLLVLVLFGGSCTAGPTGARVASVHLEETVCKGLARTLLWNITETLAVDQMFKGLNCTEQNPEVLRTQTLSVCAPQHSKCLDSSEFLFDEDKCLQSVLEDLRYYWTTFKSYPDPDHILKMSVLQSINNLIQNCFSASLMDNSQSQVSTEHENSFEGRLRLCKTLKGFQIRAVTINRVLNHILTRDTGVNI